MPELLFISEKPSLAKAIAETRAKMLGVKASKGQHHWTVGPDAVAWLYGHMYELVNPGHYDERYEKWRVDDLPIIPSVWKREVKKVYEGGKINAQKTKDILAQVMAIKDLVKNSKTVVNAGDPEREGQLLVDELLQEFGWDPFNARTKRFWCQSLTEAEITKNINSMFPNAEKQNLFNAAFTRQRADWLHGLNMTRLYTGLARRSGADMLLSVGRVQTPVVKLVVDRDREIARFKPTDHFMPTGLFVHQNGKFKATWIIPDDHAGVDAEGRLVDKAVAQSVLEKIAGKPGIVSEFETKNASKSPPLPYSLSALQQACSAKFGLTAQQTLDVAQSLYEKKATSYPRTDSRHLPTSIFKEEASTIMSAMASTPGVDRAAQTADLKLRSKAWDDSKVSDHHGIIPTTEFHSGKLNDMSPIERNVFMLIAKSFVAQFHPDQTWKSISAMVKCEGYSFKANGKLPISQGWRVVYDGETDEEDEDDKGEDNQNLPSMKRGDPVTAEKGELVAKRTQPPAAFTDGTLIAAMTNIHKFVTDPQLKQRLKESDGIGTEATRSNIIETLINARKFLQRTGSSKTKKITSTQAGQSVVDALPNEMTSPGLTAIWEAQLQKISKGEADEGQFMKVLAETIHKRVEHGKTQTVTIKGKSLEPLKGDGEACPKCGKGRMQTKAFLKGDQKGQRYLACDNYHGKDDPKNCGYAVWPDRPKAEAPPPAAGHGKPCPKCGKGHMVTKKSAKTGTIYLSCDQWFGKDDPKNCSHYEFLEDKVDKMAGDGEPCSKCGKGHMRTVPVRKGPNAGKTFLSCSAYPACDNKSFPDSFGGGKGGGGGKAAPAKSSAKGSSKTPPKGAGAGARPNPFAKR